MYVCCLCSSGVALPAACWVVVWRISLPEGVLGLSAEEVESAYVHDTCGVCFAALKLVVLPCREFWLAGCAHAMTHMGLLGVSPGAVLVMSEKQHGNFMAAAFAWAACPDGLAVYFRVVQLVLVLPSC